MRMIYASAITTYKILGDFDKRVTLATKGGLSVKIPYLRSSLCIALMAVACLWLLSTTTIGYSHRNKLLDH